MGESRGSKIPRILLDEPACEGCPSFECLKACPKKPESRKIFNCQHCHSLEATCEKGVCEYGARVKSTDGTIAKCDLCKGLQPPLCVSACKKGALRLDRDFLGWRLLPPLEGGYTAAGHCDFSFSAAEERVLELLLSRLRERALSPQAAEGVGGDKEKLLKMLRSVCEESGFALEKSRASAVVSAAGMNSSGFGVLDLLLQDDGLEEIAVVGANRKIYVFHKARGWLSSNCIFTSEEAAVNAINKMARPLGRRVTFQSPRLNASLEGGNTRLHAAIPPLSHGVEITLRRFSKNPLSVADLVSLGTIDCKAAAFLWLALQADVSMLVAGNTGSGKTSTLNALLSFVPLNERLVLVEETPELRLLHKHCVRLVANEELGISMKELVKDTLRMRPDRVVVGEVRGKDEVEALFDSVLAGQARGTYATMHAKTGQDALSRLKSFGVCESDLDAIDLVVVQRRIPVYDSKNKRQMELRRVTEIAEVASGKAALLYKHAAPKDKLVECGKSGLLERLCANYKSTPAQLVREMKRREKFLQDASRKNDSGFEGFAGAVQEYLFGKRSV